MKKFVTMGLGIVIGLAMAGPVALAAEHFLKAYPSTQTFYVDGNPAELEAYAINGYNYVKLRDIGQAVGFNVYYDAENNAAMMESDQPYAGEAPQKNMASPGNDHSAQANPAIFTGELTHEVYNGFASALEGKTPEPFAVSGTKANNVASMLSLYPKYSLSAAGDGKYICQVKKLSVYTAPIEHTQSFIDGLAGKSQRQKVEDIVWYVCDRLTYSVEYPFVDDVLTQDGEVKGCCMAYAYCVQFLCSRAEIPCILASSSSHQWNKVYVDGKWWNVDATANDDTLNGSNRSLSMILCPDSEMQGAIYKVANPEATRFAMELLAPGSTK